MPFGLYLLPANNVPITEETIALLYQPEVFIASGTVATTIPGAAGRTVRVTASGANSVHPGATIMQADSGADKIVTITSTRAGYYRFNVSGGPRGSFGLFFRNTSGDTIVSTDDYMYAFVGNARFTNTFKPESYGQFGASGVGRVNNSADKFYIYHVDSVFAPIAFVQVLANGGRFLVTSVQAVGTNLWEVVVGGSDWTTPPAVKCFAKMSGPGGPGFGFKLMDGTAANNRTFDTTEKMLTIDQIHDWPAQFVAGASPLTQALPNNVPNPYIMNTTPGFPMGHRSTSAGGALFNNFEYAAGFSGSGAQILRNSQGVLNYTYQDDGATNFQELAADRTYTINGANYT